MTEREAYQAVYGDLVNHVPHYQRYDGRIYNYNVVKFHDEPFHLLIPYQQYSVTPRPKTVKRNKKKVL
jgi:hypothetical protein